MCVGKQVNVQTERIITPSRKGKALPRPGFLIVFCGGPS